MRIFGHFSAFFGPLKKVAFFGAPAEKSQKSPTGRISPKSSDFRVRPPESGVSSARPGPADQGPLRAPRVGICQGFLRRSATENLFLSTPTGPEIFFRRTASEKFIFVSLRLDGKKNIFFSRRDRDGSPVLGRGKKINFFPGGSVGLRPRNLFLSVTDWMKKCQRVL